jgi:predicted house-cleaning NTP pyrophosphatase (Maf/HAM1 superfamily)
VSFERVGVVCDGKKLSRILDSVKNHPQLEHHGADFLLDTLPGESNALLTGCQVLVPSNAFEEPSRRAIRRELSQERVTTYVRGRLSLGHAGTILADY